MKDPLESVEVKSRRAGFVVIAVVLALIAWAVTAPTAAAVVGVILCLPIIIMLHEAAHFVTAKRAGMKVTEFFVGFGPRLWSVTRGETEYGIKLFILGGYCKIIGMTNLEDVPPEDEPRAYRQKPWHSKVIVAGAGSAMHFLLATILMFTVLWAAGDIGNRQTTTTLTQVSSGAQDAGLEPGDKVLSIDGTPISDWDQVRQVIGGDDGNAHDEGDTVRIVVDRDGATLTKDVTLSVDETTGERRVVAGIAPVTTVPALGFGAALTKAPGEIVSVMGESAKALGQTFSPSGIGDYFSTLAGTSETDKNGDGQTGDTRFVSPVGFGKLSYDAVRAGWVTVMGLLIMINVFVGLFNLVPLLPFDGGHIAIASYEKIMSMAQRRRVQVDVAKLMPVTIAVVAVLGFIFLSSLFLDVSRPLSNPF